MIARTLYAAAFFTASLTAFLLSLTFAAAVCAGNSESEDMEDRVRMGLCAVGLFLASLALAATGFLVMGL